MARHNSKMFFTLAFFLSACGSKTSSPSGDDNPPASASASATSLVEAQNPPVEYYDEILRQKLTNLGQVETASSSSILFVNFDGGGVDKGFKAHQSYVLCQSHAEIDPAKMTQDLRAGILSKVQSYFKTSGINVTVTDSEPQSKNYRTVFVVSSPKQLGCSDARKRSGLAPADHGGFHPNSVAFVFADQKTNPASTSVLVAQAFGFMLGLEATEEPKDLMSAKWSGQQIGFMSGKISGSDQTQDALAILKGKINGDVPADLVASSGISQVDSINRLVLQLGDKNVLDTSALIAELTKILPPGVVTPTLDKIITVIAILQNAALKQQSSRKDRINNGTQNLLDLLNSPSFKSITSILALAGFPSIEAGVVGIQLIGNLILGITKPTAEEIAAKKLNVLPNFAQLIGVDQATTAAKLFQTLDEYQKALLSNYSGANRDTIASFLKVAFAQAYQVYR